MSSITPETASPEAPETSAPVEAPSERANLADRIKAAFTMEGPDGAPPAVVLPPEGDEAPAAKAKAPAPKKEHGGPKSPPKSADVSAEEKARRTRSIQEAKAKQELAKERDTAAAELKEFKEWKEKRASAPTDPRGWIEFGGFKSMDEFSAAVLERGALTPAEQKVYQLEKQLQEDRAAQAAASKAAQEAQAQAQYQAQLDNAHKHVVNYLEQDERFEFSRIGNGPATVLQIADELSRREDYSHYSPVEILEQAATQVEAYLDAEADRLTQVKKMQKKFGAAKAEPSAAQSASRQAPRTISSKMAGTTAPAKQQSDEDRMASFAAGLRETLARRR